MVDRKCCSHLLLVLVEVQLFHRMCDLELVRFHHSTSIRSPTISNRRRLMIWVTPCHAAVVVMINSAVANQTNPGTYKGEDKKTSTFT